VNRQDRVSFQIDVNRALVATTRPHLPGKMGVLTEAEMNEADRWCEAGRTGTEYGEMLRKQDANAQVA
jgi:hypothetical protein